MPVDSNYMNAKNPVMKSGKQLRCRPVLAELNQKYSGKNGEWVKTLSDGKTTQVESLAITNKTVPDLSGMGAKDAVFLCERLGLVVNFSGIGKIVSQSLAPDTAVHRATNYTDFKINQPSKKGRDELNRFILKYYY